MHVQNTELTTESHVLQRELQMRKQDVEQVSYYLKTN